MSIWGREGCIARFQERGGGSDPWAGSVSESLGIPRLSVRGKWTSTAIACREPTSFRARATVFPFLQSEILFFLASSYMEGGKGQNAKNGMTSEEIFGSSRSNLEGKRDAYDDVGDDVERVTE